jgi:hypothetical protein
MQKIFETIDNTFKETNSIKKNARLAGFDTCHRPGISEMKLTGFLLKIILLKPQWKLQD